jgi:hypothetical protein
LAGRLLRAFEDSCGAHVNSDQFAPDASLPAAKMGGSTPRMQPAHVDFTDSERRHDPEGGA